MSFLNIVLLAEEAGIKLEVHLDMYQRLLDIYPSENSKLEFCLGSVAEMTEGDVYEATDSYSKQNKLLYQELRRKIN